MKNAFASVTLSAALSAYAATPQTQEPVSAPAPAAAQEPAAVPAPPAASPEAQQAPEGQAAPATGVSAAADGKLPNVALSSELMYKLTRAELEFKQGNWQGPYMTMMGAAQQTRDPRLAHRAAEMALAAKQGGEALAAIRLWRELAPESEEAVQYFLGFIVLSDQMEEAEPLFAQRLRDAKPGMRGVAMLQMQQFLARARDELVAYAILERVLAPYADTAEAHLVLAQGAIGLGENPRALREAQKALEIKPDSELAILTMAQASPDAAAAAGVLSAFLEKYPEAREVRAAYARILVDQQQFEPAREQFLALLKAQPDNVATIYALGVMSMQLNQVDVAEGYFKRFLAVLEAHPGDERDPSKVLNILSQIAEERGDVAGAIKWLEQIDSSDTRPYFNGRIRTAQLMARAGKLDAGRKVLAGLKAEAPAEQVQVLLADAQMLRDGGYAQSAFTVLENGLKRFPNQPELLYDFALAAEKMGQVEIMEASLLQVIKLAPDNQHAYNALGYSLAERNVRLPEAYALIEQALKMAPNDPFIMDSMGWVQFRMGKLDEAEVLLRRAYALRSDPEIAVHLGEVLWQKGEKANAQQLWRAARAKDPKNDTLKNTLARLNTSL